MVEWISSKKSCHKSNQEHLWWFPGLARRRKKLKIIIITWSGTKYATKVGKVFGFLKKIFTLHL
jgi:hypothetical protein